MYVVDPQRVHSLIEETFKSSTELQFRFINAKKEVCELCK